MLSNRNKIYISITIIIITICTYWLFGYIWSLMEISLCMPNEHLINISGPNNIRLNALCLDPDVLNMYSYSYAFIKKDVGE